MSDDDLKRLKDAPVPQARAEAKARALAAAAQAFAAQQGDAGTARNESPAATQTVVPLARPTEVNIRPRRRIMISRQYALAASVAALFVVPFAAMQFMRPASVQVLEPVSKVASGVHTSVPQETVAKSAVPDVRRAEALPAAPEPSPSMAPSPQAAAVNPPRPAPAAKAAPLPGRQSLTVYPPSGGVTEDLQERGVLPFKAPAGPAEAKLGFSERPQASEPVDSSVKQKAGFLAPAAKAPSPSLTPEQAQARDGLIQRHHAIAEAARAAAKDAGLDLDNPQSRQTYLGIDNANSATRFGFRGDATVSSPLQTAETELRHLQALTTKGASPNPRLLALERELQRLRAEEDDIKQQHQRLYAAIGEQQRVAAERQRIAQEQRDRFEALEMNPIKRVADEPVSTFSLDVDTASYAIARRQLNSGHLPRRDSVRVEEFINYFPYSYPRPISADSPFAPQITVLPSPWNAQTKLLHIGVKGFELNQALRPRANLVFLVDISGSMQPSDRLPLLKNAFRMLVEQMKPDDTIGIVTYANGSDIRLRPTPVRERATILAAIDSLNAGGSTHGAQGIADAYRLAEANFDRQGVNRIILGTDGDWNVGITNREQLKGFIEEKRKTGIYLSILGVGMGNYNDALMQTLAKNGNGIAAYIDTLNEARKVLVEQASSSLFPIANDVKVQIEFNPATVREYRLIGYEKRMLRREDFNNDKVDAGDVGSGHTVTAIYEITPIEAIATSDPLRYGQDGRAAAPTSVVPRDGGSEYGFLKLRYKLPGSDTSQLLSTPISLGLDVGDVVRAPQDVRFSVAVAAFGQLLRGSPHLKGFDFGAVLKLAQDARGEDPFGYRQEFINLVRIAMTAAP